MVAFDSTKDFTTSDIYSRTSLEAGMQVTGPAVIEQSDATTLVPPNHVALVDEWLNLRISEVA